MKNGVVVLQPEDGEGIWQPQPSTGYTISKITPDNAPYNFATGLQILEPGAHIRRHAHAEAHEFLFCYAGTGHAELGDIRYDIVPETMMMIDCGIQHTIFNTGDIAMRLLWFISPAGLEEWFRAIGKPRLPGEPMPEKFERPDDIEEIQDRLKFIRPT